MAASHGFSPYLNSCCLHKLACLCTVVRLRRSCVIQQYGHINRACQLRHCWLQDGKVGAADCCLDPVADGVMAVCPEPLKLLLGLLLVELWDLVIGHDLQQPNRLCHRLRQPERRLQSVKRL
jgi:hypothetical protein